MMVNPSSAACCYISCLRPDKRESLRMVIWLPSDLPSLKTAIHSECFHQAKDPSVLPDPPEEHGRIPPNARCLFCGKQLPIIGQHPFAMEVWESDSAGRYWAHADCMQENVDLPQE